MTDGERGCERITSGATDTSCRATKHGNQPRREYHAAPAPGWYRQPETRVINTPFVFGANLR